MFGTINNLFLTHFVSSAYKYKTIAQVNEQRVDLTA